MRHRSSAATDNHQHPFPGIRMQKTKEEILYGIMAIFFEQAVYMEWGKGMAYWSIPCLVCSTSLRWLSAAWNVRMWKIGSIIMPRPSCLRCKLRPLEPCVRKIMWMVSSRTGGVNDGLKSHFSCSAGQCCRLIIWWSHSALGIGWCHNWATVH